jgi:hypothetical protein
VTKYQALILIEEAVILFYGEISPNFDLYKGFFMEVNGPNSPDFKWKK